MSESEISMNEVGGPAAVDELADLRWQLRQSATALARGRDERVIHFVDALMRLDFGRGGAPAGLETGALDAKCAQSEPSSKDLHLSLRIELLEHARRQLRCCQFESAAMLIGAYEQLMRAGL